MVRCLENKPIRYHSCPGSIIIDANFVTLISTTTHVATKRLWTWLNSNMFRIICELYAVPLGGGALKVEACFISTVPVSKVVSEKDETCFDKLVESLQEQDIKGRND